MRQEQLPGVLRARRVFPRKRRDGMWLRGTCVPDVRDGRSGVRGPAVRDPVRRGNVCRLLREQSMRLRDRCDGVWPARRAVRRLHVGRLVVRFGGGRGGGGVRGTRGELQSANVHCGLLRFARCLRKWDSDFGMRNGRRFVPELPGGHVLPRTEVRPSELHAAAVPRLLR